MRTLLTIAGLALAVGSLSGCAMASGAGVSGFVYSGHTIGSSVGPGQGTKEGEACAASYVGVVGLGDASIEAAKREGGITQVQSVDHTIFSILGIYAKSCTRVTGS